MVGWHTWGDESWLAIEQKDGTIRLHRNDNPDSVAFLNYNKPEDRRSKTSPTHGGNLYSSDAAEYERHKQRRHRFSAWLDERTKFLRVRPHQEWDGEPPFEQLELPLQDPAGRLFNQLRDFESSQVAQIGEIHDAMEEFRTLIDGPEFRRRQTKAAMPTAIFTIIEVGLLSWGFSWLVDAQQASHERAALIASLAGLAVFFAWRASAAIANWMRVAAAAWWTRRANRPRRVPNLQTKPDDLLIASTRTAVESDGGAPIPRNWTHPREAPIRHRIAKDPKTFARILERNGHVRIKGTRLHAREGTLAETAALRRLFDGKKHASIQDLSTTIEAQFQANGHRAIKLLETLNVSEDFAAWSSARDHP